MRAFLKFLFAMMVALTASSMAVGQEKGIAFGTEDRFIAVVAGQAKPEQIQWVNVNTAADTWRRDGELLVCTGHPIGVMRSERQYENYILTVEWRHMEAGGNSGMFMWSDDKPGAQNRLPGGVEVQMLTSEENTSELQSLIRITY